VTVQVKGCRMPAGDRQGVRPPKLRGQASDKPPGRKPRAASRWPGWPATLWGLEGSRCWGCGRRDRPGTCWCSRRSLGSARRAGFGGADGGSRSGPWVVGPKRSRSVARGEATGGGESLGCAPSCGGLCGPRGEITRPAASNATVARSALQVDSQAIGGQGCRTSRHAIRASGSDTSPTRPTRQATAGRPATRTRGHRRSVCAGKRRARRPATHRGWRRGWHLGQRPAKRRPSRARPARWRHRQGW
jgi:hypothetical protein